MVSVGVMRMVWNGEGGSEIDGGVDEDGLEW